MDRPLSDQEERSVQGVGEDALPVRIARSALAPNVPHADLYVTAHHSCWSMACWFQRRC